MKFTLTPVFEEFGFSVYVPEGFEVLIKDLPFELQKRYGEITWFGNFELRALDGKTPKKLWFKYEIRVAKNPAEQREFSELVFWDGEFIVPLTEEFHDFREVMEGERTYFRAKLSLTDPPCGAR
ncbi:MAG: hypothetical protein JXA78_11005 [Anaerolineales bacterium]|nr:hypothetical protein [Anaerolineales bacterium]